MKKYIPFLILFILSSLTLLAQPHSEKIGSLKVGYITEKLNLDAKTAEKFWPIYHQYENELRLVVQEQKRLNQNETRSVEEILEQEQKALDIKKKYTALFSRVITNEQVNQLYKAEKDFRQILLQRAQRREMRNESLENRPGRMERSRPVQPRPERMNPRPLPDQTNRPNRPRPIPQNAPAPGTPENRRSLNR